MGVPSLKISGLQVANNDDELVLHSLKRYEFSQTTCNVTDFTTTDIYFLIVKSVSLSVLLDPGNLTNSDIDLGELVEICSLLLLWWGLLLFLFTLLLFLLFLLFGGATVNLGWFSSLGCFLFRWSRFLFLGFFLFFFLCFFLLLCGLNLLIFLQLSFGGLTFTLIWETNEEAEIIDLLVKTWQMLYVINPSKCVTHLCLLVVL